jgi:hypothetical protein
MKNPAKNPKIFFNKKINVRIIVRDKNIRE